MKFQAISEASQFNKKVCAIFEASKQRGFPTNFHKLVHHSSRWCSFWSKLGENPLNYHIKLCAKHEASKLNLSAIFEASYTLHKTIFFSSQGCPFHKKFGKDNSKLYYFHLSANFEASNVNNVLLLRLQLLLF